MLFTQYQAKATVALHEYYGQRFTVLPEAQQAALITDLAFMIRDDGLWPREAMHLLDSRIGNALESYAKTLIAGKQEQWPDDGLAPNDLAQLARDWAREDRETLLED